MILFLLYAFIAEIVGTILGFGSATLLTPFAAFFMDIKVVIPLVAVFHFLGVLFRAILFKGSIVWKIAALFTLPGILFSLLGAALVFLLPSRAIEIALGIFLLVYGFLELSGREIFLPKRDQFVLAGGALVGFLAGITGTVGPLRTAFLASFKLSKEKFLGTSAAIAVFVDLTRVGVYWGSGLLNVSLAMGIALVLVAFLGTWVGKDLAMELKGKTFYRLIYFALLLAGVKFIFG